MNMMGSGATKNAVPTALLLLGAQRGVAMSQGVDVPMDVQLEGALVGGISAVAVDSTIRDQNAIIRALAVGGLTAGGMYLWKNDAMWMVWLSASAASYIASDWATSSMM